MMCPCCKTDMIKRNGVYGEFFYCRQHGTISVQSNKIVATGEIRKKVSAIEYKQLALKDVGNSVLDQPSLELQMERQMMAFGVRLTEMDRFIEGETIELQQVAAIDDEDHWLNQRQY